MARDTQRGGRERHGLSWVTALIRAVEPGTPVLIHLLMDAGARVDAAMEDGHTALMFAAVHGFPSVVEALLQRGAEVNVQYRRGETALSRLRHVEGWLQIVQLLSGAGAVD